MRKKSNGCFCFCLLLGIILFVGCGSPAEKWGEHQQENVNASFRTAYLGNSDQVLVKEKGTGIENIAVVDGKKVILSRVYQEKFLGYDSELTVMLSSGGTVEYALYSLEGEKEAVAAALSEILGKTEPDMVDTQEPGLGYKAIWRQDAYIYTMIAEENRVTVAIIKE